MYLINLFYMVILAASFAISDQSAVSTSRIRQRHHNTHSDDLQLGAVFMLLSDWRMLRYGRKCHFNASMDAMATKWRPHNPYTIILMDTKPWQRQDMVDIRRTWFTLDFKFININKVWESAPNIDADQFEDSAKPISKLHYKRMCHFFFKGFTEVPLLMEYKYLLRIDDDTCLLDHINFDIFERLQQKNAAYAYSHVWFDSDLVTKGLYNLVDEFVQKNNVTWKNEALHNSSIYRQDFPKTVPAFNTNFEVINTVRYREPDVMQFVDAVVESNMIFHRRWGDAPLRVPTAALFWTEREIVRLEGFEVQHSAWEVMPMTEHTDSNNPQM